MRGSLTTCHTTLHSAAHHPSPRCALISMVLHRPTPSLLFPLVVAIAAAASSSPNSTASTSRIGINYGQIADNLPPPSSVLPLIRSLSASHVKLYDADPRVLSAFAGSGLNLAVDLPDRLLPRFALEPAAAPAWVLSALCPYLPATHISTVTVGNEVLSSNDSALVRSLLPAMRSLRSALAAAGFGPRVAVTTAHSLAILASSFPPSAATFRPELLPFLVPLLKFLAESGAPFLINAYPYFAYKADPAGVDLNYVLGEPNRGVVDPGTGLRYENMLHAQVDAVRAAIAKAVGESGRGKRGAAVEIRVSETGWPSAGDEDEAGATAENARRYNRNLMRMVAEGKGTPAAPADPFQVYVFALFNENQKPGPTSERHYGLFKPDGTPAYDLGLTPVEAPRSAGAAAQSPSQMTDKSSTGYNISSAMGGRWLWRNKILALVSLASVVGWYWF